MLSMHPASNLFNDATEPDASLLNELKPPYQCLSLLQQHRIKMLLSIKFKENKTSRLIIKCIRRHFLQSGLKWQDYIIATKLNGIKQFDLKTFSELEKYHQLSNPVTWYSLAYFDTNLCKFTNDINAILEKESVIYRYLCTLNIKPNCCFVMESRHTQLTKSHTNNMNKPVSDQERKTLNHTFSRWVYTTVHKENEVQLLFAGFIKKYDVQMPQDLIDACIQFTYGCCYTVERLLKHNVTKSEPGPWSYGHFNINWNQNDAELVQVHRSKVHDYGIMNRWSLLHHLNSVHSEHNTPNTMTWQYIVYEDNIEINMYIKNEDGKSYGTPMNADNIQTVVSSLFVDDIKVSLDAFKSATDPTLDEYSRCVLHKSPHEESQIDDVEFDELNEDIISNWNQEEHLMGYKLSQQNNYSIMGSGISYEHGHVESMDTIIDFDHSPQE